MKPFVVRASYAAIAVIAVPLVAWNGLAQQLNASLNDMLQRLRSSVEEGGVQEIVLVAIDDRTAARYGPLPLSRSRLAEGLDRLVQLRPKVLAVDLILSEPGDATGDEALARVLSRAPDPVLGAALESDPAAPPRWILPLPAFSASAAVAHVHAAADPDGAVRSVLLAKADEGRRLWALGLEAARLAMDAPKPLEMRDSLELGSIRIPSGEAGHRQMYIHFAGPEGTFGRLSFGSLLDGQVAPEAVRDKIAVVGVTAQGAGDRLFTPYSAGLGMSGIEIHANIMRTILDRSFLVPLSLPVECVIYAVIVMACLAAVRVVRGTRLVALFAFGALVIPLVGRLSLEGGHIWPVGSMLAVFVVSAAIAGGSEYALAVRQLRSAEARRKEYALRMQSIAHEIKTPLTAIQGTSEMISQGLVPDRERTEMAGLIFKESKRLSSMIRTFLDVEQIAAGALKLEKQPVDLPGLCEEVLERARLYAARKQITIQGEVPEANLMADRDLLSFAIYNLLTNAVKYSPKGTGIRLSAAAEDSAVSVSVTDQGYGIDLAEQHRIFERFYRLKRDAEGSEEGSGIGLALVKEIVEQHGGRVLVESRPGAGSRFTLVLPKGE